MDREKKLLFENIFTFFANHFGDFDSETNSEALCLSNEIEAILAENK